jgi:alpha-maltose-1-phosphate synthase
MKVALSVLGKFHTFDLARQLHATGSLARIFTGYPRYKLRDEQLPDALVDTYPWVNTPYLAFPQRERLGTTLLRGWEYVNCLSFDRHTARHMPECDVFVGLSSSTLRSGRRAKSMGARFVCDRGSSHIRKQDELLRDEYARWGMPYMPIDPRIIAREEAEYAEADAITVPSSFSARTFRELGVPHAKVHQLSYGVNLDAFHPTMQPGQDSFDLLFVGVADLRKGVPYLLQAFKALRHPRKTLSFAGAFSPRMVRQMRELGLWSEGIQLLGHLSWSQLRDRMSASHALVLPSIEEGFGLVIPQALACGCPVIATEHTGAPDLFNDGEAGHIVPIRQVDVMTDRLQSLADDPATRDRMSQRALTVVNHIGGWRTYGDNALSLYQSLLT